MKQILKRAINLVISHPKLLFFGSIIAFPKTIVQVFLDRYGDSFGQILQSIQQNSLFLTSTPYINSLLPLLIVLFILFVESFGIVQIASFVQRSERKSFGVIPTKETVKRAASVFKMEITLILFLLFGGILLSLPSDIASARGLIPLSRLLFLSAFGLFASIAVLTFFIRQYSALYLTLSNISIRSAIENASTLFRSKMRPTILFGTIIFIWEILGMFFLSSCEYILSFMSMNNILQTGITWVFTLAFFSILEAWTWTAWTLFFRNIALPKEPLIVLQNQKTVVQQDRPASLKKMPTTAASKE